MASAMTYIISQTRQNVEYLIAQNEISMAVGREILDKLPIAGASPARKMSERKNILITPPTSVPSLPSSPAGVRFESYVPPRIPPPPLFYGKAIWGYGETPAAEPGDLPFRAGDIVEVIEETNADWWTGRFRGREGVFPSNYVEKVDPPAELKHPGPPHHSYGPGPYSPPAGYQSRSSASMSYSSRASSSASSKARQDTQSPSSASSTS